LFRRDRPVLRGLARRRFSKLKFRFDPILVLTVATFVAAPSLAGELGVSWNASADASGYEVHYGTAPGDYPLTVDVGAATETSIDGLEDCRTWYFAATAYNAVGDAGLCNEDSSWPRPVVDGIAPASAVQGDSLTLTFTGVNFQAGTDVSFANPGVIVQSVTVVSCNEMNVAVSIEADAPPGSTGVEITNASGVSGSAGGLFAVESSVVDTTPPVIGSIGTSGVTATSATITWSTDEPADGQVFYREAGTGGYLQTPLDATLTTEHAATLGGLSPDTAYEFHVASADAAGNSATSSDATFNTTSNSYSYLTFEAEAGALVDPVRATSGPDSFAGSWIDTPGGLPNGTENDPLGSATFGVNLPNAGTWHVWIRIHGQNSSSDSWYVSLDDGPRLLVVPPERRTWIWTEGPSYVAQAGLHDLELAGREAETRADRILLTDDPDFVPTEEPGVDVDPPAPVSSFTAVPQGADGLLLGWTNPPDGDFVETVVRFRTDGRHPVSPVDGFGVARRNGAPESSDSFLHGNRQAGVTYAYSAFAVDAAGNVSVAAHATGTLGGVLEPPDPPQNLRISDAGLVQYGSPVAGAPIQPVAPARRRDWNRSAAWRRVAGFA
jgi:hypothetical protein